MPFRSHDLADAHSRLADVVVTLQTLTKLTAAVSQTEPHAAHRDPTTTARRCSGGWARARGAHHGRDE